MQYWILRNPYRHHGWQDYLFQNRILLYGIKGRFAQSCLTQMQEGDLILFYDGRLKAFSGILRVQSLPQFDRTDETGKRLEVSLKPEITFDPPLKTNDPAFVADLRTTLFVKQPRFSIIPIEETLFEKISQYSNI